MKIAFLFAGQGSQYKNMGLDFYNNYEQVKQIFLHASKKIDIKKIIFEENDLLNDTLNVQPAVLTTSYAIAKVLEIHNVKPDYVLGLSLGEYSALTYSECFNFEDALDIVIKRAEIMSKALPLKTSKMAAVFTDNLDLLLETCNKFNVYIANYNTYEQTVISGLNSNMDNAIKYLKENNVKRIIPLNVSGAFHSPLLEKASFELKEVLDKYDINKPKYEIIYNVLGKPSEENIKDLLRKQIYSSVHFVESIEYLIQQKVDLYIEIGPGKVLSSFVKKIKKDSNVFHIEDMKTLNILLESGVLNE